MGVDGVDTEGGRNRGLRAVFESVTNCWARSPKKFYKTYSCKSSYDVFVRNKHMLFQFQLSCLVGY